MTTPPPTIIPATDSRLDQLAALYAELKPQFEELKERLDEITEGIKTELRTAAPEHSNLLLNSPHLTKPLRLQLVTQWRVDSPRLKAEQPELYVHYARKSEFWRLAPVLR